jgi:hypothetical protein
MFLTNSIASSIALICWTEPTHITLSGKRIGSIIRIFPCEDSRISTEASKEFMNKYGACWPSWKSYDDNFRFHKLWYELSHILHNDGIPVGQFLEDIKVIKGFTDWIIKTQSV